MDPKELSPAYLTSLASILIGALLVGVSSTLFSVIGWFLLLAGLGLNAFSTLVMIQRLKGGPLPAALTGGQVSEEDPEEPEVANTVEPEPDTEAQQTVPVASLQAGDRAADERIFRSRPARPRVR